MAIETARAVKVWRRVQFRLPNLPAIGDQFRVSDDLGVWRRAGQG